MKDSIQISYFEEPVDLRMLLQMHEVTEDKLDSIIGNRREGEFTLGMNTYYFLDSERSEKPKRARFDLTKDGEVVLQDVNITEIAKHFGVTQSAVSQHLSKYPNKKYRGHVLEMILK